VTLAVSALVAVGIVAALAAGLSAGFDPVAVVLLAALVAVGALGIAVARRWDGVAARPARCRACGGLVSRGAPYCKHCRAPRPGDERAARDA